ncbi:MAG: class I SAM-dependent methyltransferase [Cyanobacteria bacterium P01_F01_bin.42]
MEPDKLAAQLRKPTGPQADEVAQDMNRSNARVIAACIQLLGIEACDRVLEIGPSNGSHIVSVMESADNLQYVGIDWSADMIAAAARLNSSFIEASSVELVVGDAASLPFDDGSFDKVFSVNTLYFWSDPEAQLQEIRRVIKSGGHLCLAFGDREFMQNLPFTQTGFTLYNDVEVKALLASCNFDLLQHRTYREIGESNTGKQVKKQFHLLRCGV